MTLDPETEDIAFVSDETLLARVLVNLIQEALEIGESGQVITLGSCMNDDQVEFWVRSPAHVPTPKRMETLRLRVSGRGPAPGPTGLLSDYLGGRVTVTSTRETGTTFRAIYPLQMPEPRYGLPPGETARRAEPVSGDTGEHHGA